jgi:hypothetical protein
MNAYVLAHLSRSACKHMKHIHRCRQTLKESWYLFLLIVVLFLCLPNIFGLTIASQMLQKICYNFTIKKLSLFFMYYDAKPNAGLCYIPTFKLLNKS